ncbi:MAG: flavodoxin family protein [Desulfobulbaceae bacterium]|nr:flavodoxin family protein [Desulfobulbaceae bacterium]
MERQEMSAPTTPRVLILYYSFSGQTTGLLHHLGIGLKKQGAEVCLERIRPLDPPRFPVGAILPTIKMMLTTTFRQRLPIREPDPVVWADYDLIILAGPTWSYNPSGPILDLMDRFGPRLFRDRQVLPLISCRGYWRLHWWGLRKLLRGCGAQVPNRIVFSHPAPEPWRTIGVFLKIAGKAPERSRLIGRYYKRFGHSKGQMAEAERLGEMLGSALDKTQPLSKLALQSPIATP